VIGFGGLGARGLGGSGLGLSGENFSVRILAAACVLGCSAGGVGVPCTDLDLWIRPAETC
jgi:hypothetical protein